MNVESYRGRIIQAIVDVVSTHDGLKQLADDADPKLWNEVVPPEKPLSIAAKFLVDGSFARGRVQRLLEIAIERYGESPRAPDFKEALDAMKQASLGTDPRNPFDEVILDQNRYFVNRVKLRGHLDAMTQDRGSRVLLIEGERKTGKSFSKHLLFHGARRKEYVVNTCDVSEANDDVALLAETVAGWFGKTLGDLASRSEWTKVRWAKALAESIAQLVRNQERNHIFVFDDFPDPAPDEITTFIARLAEKCDACDGLLRIVLVRFPGKLPDDVEDVALRDLAQPFSAADMFDVIARIAQARDWKVPDGLRAKLQEIEAAASSLRERGQMLRALVDHLASGAGV